MWFTAAGTRGQLFHPIGLYVRLCIELKCDTPRCVELLTMCCTCSGVRHTLVDVSSFVSCVILLLLGSVPLYVYPQISTLRPQKTGPKTAKDRVRPTKTGSLRFGLGLGGFPNLEDRSRSRSFKFEPKNRTGPDLQALITIIS